MTFSAEGRTDKGLSRRNNEDNLSVDLETGFFSVADGVGGSSSGEVASRLAVEVVGDYIRKTVSGEGVQGVRSRGVSGLKRIVSGISLANKVIIEASRKDPSLAGMATTIAAAIIEGKRLSVAHVGDSRVYLIRSGVITQLTEDHTLVSEQVRAGLLTWEEAEKSGMRNVITRALGHEDADVIDTEEVALMDGDRILLCTDGLTTMVPDETILSTVISSHEPAEGCDTLVDLANSNGGKDNITVILIYLTEKSLTDRILKFFRIKRR